MGREWTEPLLLAANAIDSADLALLPGVFRVLELDFHASPAQLAGLVLAQSWLKGLAYPLWGHVADRRPRKPLLMAAAAWWGAAAMLAACAGSFALLAVSLGAGGLALACLMPLSQSIMSDLVGPGARGRAFGRMFLAGDLGGMVGAALSTSLSAELLFGGRVRGWKLCFVLVGLLSLAMVPALRCGLAEPARGGADGHATAVGKLAPAPSAAAVLRLVLSRKTFLLLVLQGVFGNMSWVAFDSFGVLWLQYVGFSNAEVATIFLGRKLGSGLGGWFGGWLSDM